MLGTLRMAALADRFISRKFTCPFTLPKTPLGHQNIALEVGS
jgi:hypothetical protein